MHEERKPDRPRAGDGIEPMARREWTAPRLQRLGFNETDQVKDPGTDEDKEFAYSAPIS